MSDAGKGPHLLTARDGSQALCGGPGACPACEYDKRIAAADAMAKALESIAENEGESCSRCEGNGNLWADGKAHYPSDTVAIRPCPNCNGSGRMQADLQDIARAALAAYNALK